MLEFYSPKIKRMRRKRDVAGLIEALKEGGPRVRRAAANALIEMPDHRALEPLVAALADSDAAVRANAALALGEFEHSKPETLGTIVEPLAAAFDDESPPVRAMAAAALGRMKSPRAVGPLTGLLNDESELVRTTAMWVLHGFGEQGVVPEGQGSRRGERSEL